MQETALHVRKTDGSISISDLECLIQSWILESEIRQHSQSTIENRVLFGSKLVWFHREFDHDYVDHNTLKKFLAYLTTGHKCEGGRWGNKNLTKAVRPRTVQTYYINLQALFSYAEEEEIVVVSPVKRIKAPVSRQDQIQPFSDEQVEALQKAARRSKHPKRDEAIVLFLLDTGIRASELCNLLMSNLDMQGRRCRVLGKGNKHRSVFFGRTTAKALWQYLREEPRDEDACLFLSDRGTKAGEGLTRSGLRQLIERLGIVAGIQSTRCSPHTFRHTFAISLLRNGGQVFALKEFLGHTSLTICNRYVALAQADLQKQHMQYSPADGLRRR